MTPEMKAILFLNHMCHEVGWDPGFTDLHDISKYFDHEIAPQYKSDDDMIKELITDSKKKR